MYSTGKIIKIETYMMEEYKYLSHMWLRIYINKGFTPIITPFFDFMNIFQGDSNEIEKLLNSEIEWTLLNSKDSAHPFLSERKDDFIYASIRNIVYSQSYILNKCFEFKQIKSITSETKYKKPPYLIISSDSSSPIRVKWTTALDLYCLSPGSFILLKNGNIFLFRHNRSFYENVFFTDMNNPYRHEEFRKQHYNLYLNSLPEPSEPRYTRDDIINDAFEGDPSNLWNID
ncbi:MAG: hypothetical protein Q8891_00075 [Bacteroidota bacterium]|nr:hypothetical protein [Bacteroidota bacterium]